MQDPQHLTRLLNAAGTGDREALEQLAREVYADLRASAARLVAREKPGATLDPTALVHDAWLRLFQDKSGKGGFDNMGHFFGSAAEAMRRLLVERARAQQADKRGGGERPVTFHDLAVASEEPQLDLLALDEALGALRAKDEALFELARLRYFAGLTLTETAEVVGRSIASVKRDWAYARAWLARRIDSSTT